MLSELLDFGFKLADPLLGLDFRGDVFLDADVIGELVTFVEYGRDGQFIPERTAVLAVVTDDLAARRVVAASRIAARPGWSRSPACRKRQSW